MTAGPPPHLDASADDGPTATTDSAQLRSLRDLLAHRPLEVDLELALEQRVRAYAQRLNQRLARSGDDDLYDASNDTDLAQVVMLLCEAALDRDDASAEARRDVETQPQSRAS